MRFPRVVLSSTALRPLRDFLRVLLLPVPDIEARRSGPRAWFHTSSSDYCHAGWEMTCQRATLLRPLDSCLATIKREIHSNQGRASIHHDDEHRRLCRSLRASLWLRSYSTLFASKSVGCSPAEPFAAVPYLQSTCKRSFLHLYKLHRGIEWIAPYRERYKGQSV